MFVLFTLEINGFCEKKEYFEWEYYYVMFPRMKRDAWSGTNVLVLSSFATWFDETSRVKDKCIKHFYLKVSFHDWVYSKGQQARQALAEKIRKISRNTKDFHLHSNLHGGGKFHKYFNLLPPADISRLCL